jgi:hypothetical protein
VSGSRRLIGAAANDGGPSQLESAHLAAAISDLGSLDAVSTREQQTDWPMRLGGAKTAKKLANLHLQRTPKPLCRDLIIGATFYFSAPSNGLDVAAAILYSLFPLLAFRPIRNELLTLR